MTEARLHFRGPALLLGALAALLSGCDEAPRHELSVDVRTDAVPGTDFERVRMDLGTTPFVGTSERETQDLVADADAPFTEGVRVAEYRSLPPGGYYVRAALLQGETVRAEETRPLSLRGDHALVFAFSRTCLGVRCGEGERCADGACVTDGPDAGLCTGDDDCRDLLGPSCGRVTCAAGTCLCTCALEDGGASLGGGGCSSEDCTNGSDDDGDELADCEDPDCDRLSCSDGNACTVGDQCQGGTCAASPKDCAAPPGPCQTNACNPATGECELGAVPDGTPCPAHPQRCCAGTCADLSADETNCGGCGIACKAPYQCVSSGGEYVCDCSDSAPANTQCPTGHICSSTHKVCACSPGGCPAGQTCTARSGPDYCDYP